MGLKFPCRPLADFCLEALTGATGEVEGVLLFVRVGRGLECSCLGGRISGCRGAVELGVKLWVSALGFMILCWKFSV